MNWRWLAAAIALVLTSGSGLWFLCHLGHGFSYADEGMYLHRIADPWRHTAFFSLFGFVYHPIFRIVDGNITALRAVNSVIMVLIAHALAIRVLRLISWPWHTSTAQITAATLAASVILPQQITWITPSYNTLALSSTLLVAWALTEITKRAQGNFGPWFVLAIGGWLAFLGKPTTAVGLCTLTGIHIAATGRLRDARWMVSLAIALTLVFVTIITIYGSIGEFVDRSADALHRVHVRDSRHGWDDLLAPPLVLVRHLAPFVGALALSLALSFSSRVRRFAVNHAGTAALAAAVCAVLTVLSSSHWIEYHRRAQLLVLFPLGVYGFGVLSLMDRRADRAVRHERILALEFSLLPVAYVFGSNVAFYAKALETAILWLLAAVLFAGGRSLPRASARDLLLAVALMTSITGVATLVRGVVRPMQRLSALSARFVETEIGGSTLWVHEKSARFNREVQHTFARHGFHPGDPILDLSGRFPGLVFSVRGTPMGSAWLVGGHPGSAGDATMALALNDCHDLARAWLISAPEDQHRAISRQVVRSFGADPDADFERVDIHDLPVDNHSAPFMRAEIWRPKRTPKDGAAACLSLRAATPESGSAMQHVVSPAGSVQG